MRIKIIVDSASDFTQKQATELGLQFLPMHVTLDGEEYLDGVTLFAEEFYQKLEACKTMPQTSLINEYRWNEAFQEATKDGSDVVAITISSKLSGTYQAAVNASKNFGGKVFVVDSMTAAYGEGVLAEYALRLRNEGKSGREIYDKLNEKKGDVCVYAVMDTLKYLKKGGRISAATAIVGATLSIKPLIALLDGEVKMLGRAMGNKKANASLNKLVEAAGGIDFDMPWSYLWSGNDKTNVDRYRKDSGCLVGERECPLRHLGSTIGAHIGPGAVGLAFFKK